MFCRSHNLKCCAYGIANSLHTVSIHIQTSRQQSLRLLMRFVRESYFALERAGFDLAIFIQATSPETVNLYCTAMV